MLAALLFISYSLVILYQYGWVCAKLIGRLLVSEPGADLPFPLTGLLGLCAVVTLAEMLSLFMPLGAQAHGVLLAGALLSLLWGWKKRLRDWHCKWEELRSTPGLFWLLGALVFLTILSNASQPPSNYDTGIYHAQAIHWFERFGAVPGLGNLHTRFAFNSSWLVGTAIFSFAFFNVQSFRLLTSVLFLLCCLYLLSGVKNHLQRRAAPSDTLALLLLPFSFEVLGSQISSPGSDLPVTLLFWVLALEWMKRSERGEAGFSLRSALFFSLCLFSLTIKLSSLPLLLLGLGVWMQAIRTDRKIGLGLALLGGLLLAPWVALNVVLSGYLIYPYTSLMCFGWTGRCHSTC